jgi:hypothetical protein
VHFPVMANLTHCASCLSTALLYPFLFELSLTILIFDSTLWPQRAFAIG